MQRFAESIGSPQSVQWDIVAGVQVLLQQMNQTSKSTSLLNSILGCFVCALQQEHAVSKVKALSSDMPACAPLDTLTLLYAGEPV